ncbi:hypothetical protein COCOBI_12-0280 [Coccomyxa sp. Obi]|nr:hypothetical protein COCOBI_12-0280 [Coccomyxa sp. Obi]
MLQNIFTGVAASHETRIISGSCGSAVSLAPTTRVVSCCVCEMDPISKRLEKVDKDLEIASAEVKEAQEKWFRTTDPQQKADLREIWEHAEAYKKELLAKQGMLEAQLAGSGLGMRPASEEVERFAKNAPAAKMVGNWLELPAGTHFMGKPKLGSILYVRKAYRLLLWALRRMKMKGFCHVVISGNPGVGKSWFAMFLLVWGVLGCCLGVAQVWQISHLASPHCILPVWKITKEYAEERLGCDQRVKYVADGVTPVYNPLAAEQSVVAHSPDVERFKEYMKQEGHLPSPLWMPTWDDYEMEELRARRFENIDHQMMMQLIAQRGGIPRAVLMNASDESAEQTLAFAINPLTWDDFSKVVDPNNLKASHKLAKVHPPRWEEGNFSNYQVSWLSTYIKEKAVLHVMGKALMSIEALTAMAMMSSTEASSPTSSFVPYRGCALMPTDELPSWWYKICMPPVHSLLSSSVQFEGHAAKFALETLAHISLANGITWQKRVCPPKSSKQKQGHDVGPLTWPALPSFHFTYAEQLSELPAGDWYCKPSGSTYPAIDGIAVVDGRAHLIQVTSNTQHGISARLADTLACLPAHLEIEFIWAVPPKVWAEKTLNAQDVPEQKGARPATPGPERDSYDRVAERLKACKKQFKIPVDMMDALAEYRMRHSAMKSSSAPSDARDVGTSSPHNGDEPGMGASGGFAAIPRIPASIGRVCGANPKSSKWRSALRGRPSIPVKPLRSYVSQPRLLPRALFSAGVPVHATWM